MEPFTIIEVLANGSTNPAIEEETEILLIQDGEVTVGMLTCEGDDISSTYIDSPINEEELNKEALELVKARFPEYLETKSSIVLVAPEEIAAKMEW